MSSDSMTNRGFGLLPARDDGKFAGLQALEAPAFPRRCGCCGREYASAQEFIAATAAVSDRHSGLKQGFDQAGRPMVELFRNCRCGSTLMERFQDRRETTEEGIARRQHFESLLDLLKSRALIRDLLQSSRENAGTGPSQHGEVTAGATGALEHQDSGKAS